MLYVIIHEPFKTVQCLGGALFSPSECVGREKLTMNNA